MTVTERLVVALAAAALAAGAVVLAAAAFRSPRPRPTVSRRVGANATTVAVALLAALVVLAITRWPIAAAATAALVVVWSSLFQSEAATRERRRVAAIAKWLEDLRDLQRGSNLDLPQALDRSATRAPRDIAAELSRFVDRVRHHTPLDDALLVLAAELDHPTSDMAIAAMIFAHGHASGSVLHDTFEELARTARDELIARDQIDRLRARFESSMRRMLVILAVLICYLLIASRDTLEEYETAAGQAWLVVPIGIWAIALWWLRRLSRYERGGRYLDYQAVSQAAEVGVVTLLQAAFAAAVAVVLAGWCLHRAVTVSAPSVASVYRRLYGERFTTSPASTSRWERPTVAVGRMLAATATGQRLAERRMFELRVAEVTPSAVATRVVTATVVGFVAAVVAVLLPVTAGAVWPWWLIVLAPLAVAVLAGWYQYTAVSAMLRRRYGEFRAGVAAYIALVSVCLTTRRSATEAVHYASEVGTGKAFETIAAAVQAAPQMGLQAWEALDAVGAEYGARELEDLATSIANVATVGVGVESTVVAVAARMRQVGLDEMQRQADRQTAAMFGPTMLFVVGTVAFLAYPLAQRVLDAFTNTTT